jgi:DNA-binding winged helix-turn-helix (wHTH) protein/tetratricopeptide (TPR) repeat protein
MHQAGSPIYEFQGFRLDAGKRVLLEGGKVIPLTPKVFDTLLYMLEHAGETFSKEALMQAVWPDTIVEENNLNQNISMLRRVLGEKRGENRYIATIPGRGYQFTASVVSIGGASAKAESSTRGETRVALAVLPFDNMTGDAERAYLADGLTEETIAAMGQVDPDHLSVIGRTSVMRYRNTAKSIAEIGGELGVGYVVESSLRAEGPRLRITSKLIRAHDQSQVWSGTYDSEPASILAFQRELSVTIAEQVRLRLSPARLDAMLRRQTSHAEAYDLYLHGRHFWYQLNPTGTRSAIEYFHRATALDPEYALAWSGLADAYASNPVSGDGDPRVVWPKAQDAAGRAVRLAPDLAEAQTSMAFLKFWLDWDWPGAEQAYLRAIELDPNYPLAHRMLGVVRSHMGRHAEAEGPMRRARELDPLYAMHHALSAQVAYAARDFVAAARWARQAIIVDPTFWIGHWQLAQACVSLGEPEPALGALADAARFSHNNTKTIALRAYVFAQIGRVAEAREILQVLEALARERFLAPYCIALVHLGLEEYEPALDMLERGYAVRDTHLTFLPIDAKWDPLRHHERFTALLRRCGFGP